MSRELGASLALSVLVHGGAVGTVAVVGTAWLVGSPPVPAPAALYVDLVHPVVATSERRKTVDAPTPRPPAARSRRHAGAQSDVVRSADPPPASLVAPAGEPGSLPSARPDVPPPPMAPVAPEPVVDPHGSTVPVDPMPERPPSAPLVSAPAPSAPPLPPATSPPVDAAAGSPSRVASPASPSKDPAEERRSGPSSGTIAGNRPHESGLGSLTGASEPGPARETAATAPHAGGRPPAGQGVDVARVFPGEGSGGAPAGAIPPEYEFYVRALRERIQQRLVYPATAVRRGQQGMVELEVRVGADGRLAAVEVVAGTSVDVLRTAAVAAVRGSAPFPFPSGLAGRPLVIRLPVEFRLR